MKRDLPKTHPRIAMHRRAAAVLVRDIRSMWPGLAGEWHRRDWNQQAFFAGRNFLSNALRFDRANQPEVLQ